MKTTTSVDGTSIAITQHCVQGLYAIIKEGDGEYVHTGDSVGVVMNTAKGELSFVLNSMNFGCVFDGIPLDKPLVSCVLLCYQGDSVELDTSEVKETNVSSSIPSPSSIKTKQYHRHSCANDSKC